VKSFTYEPDKERQEPILQLIPNKDYLMIIRVEDGYLKVRSDGNLEVDDSIDLDEAARTFWRSLASVYDIELKEKNR